MLRNYFLTTWRNLSRSKVFSGINILGLSVGLACCMLIMLYAKDEVSYDRFHRKGANIYRIVSQMTSPDGTVLKTGSTGMLPGPSFKNAVPEILDFVRVQSDRYTVKRGQEVFTQDALAVDENFFSVFSFPLVQGRPESVFKELRSVVLSEETARKYFGKENAVGQVLELKTGKTFEPFVVSGVARNAPQNSSIRISMLVSMKFKQSQYDDKEWVNFYLSTFVVTRPGFDVQATERKFAAVFAQEAGPQLREMKEKFGYNEKIAFSLQPLTALHLSKDYPAENGLSGASNPVYSYILSGIALFIFLIACINFVNLTLARSLKRAKEIGIRKVVGGQRRQLVAQFLGESFFLSFVAFLLAVALVNLVLPFFNALSNKALSFSYLLDAKLVAGYVGLFLLTGALAGFYPALVLSNFNPVETLYGRQQYQGRNYLSKSLVVVQFALATFLIIATIAVYTQFHYLTHFDLGYNDKNVAVVNAGHMPHDKLEVVRQELLKHPSVQLVSADQGGRWSTHAHVNGGTDVLFDLKHVDANYFPLLQIPLVKGRNFSPAFPSDTAQAVVVNESFVKTAGWKNPIGQVVDFFYQKKKYTVIGVIKDYHYTALNEKPGPQIFLSNPQYEYRDVYIKLKPGNNTQALAHLLATFKKLFPFQPYQLQFKDTENALQYEAEAKWKRIVLFGALLTLFISCIGLFGLATLSAEKRTKEIGIRKVMGASVAMIVQKLSGDFLKLVLLAALIASPAAWWAVNRWLENYPYRIAVSWWMFCFAAFLILFIALATVGYQAMKAAVANPVKSLRTE